MKLQTILLFILSVAISAGVWSVILLPGESDPSSPGEGSRDIRSVEATHAADAMRWYNNQRAYPAGRIPVDWREKAHAAIMQAKVKMPDGRTSALSWASVGPENIAGRIRSIAIDPSNSNIVYCGSVSGGMWKSTDAGANWSPTGDLAASLVIGSIVIDPTNTSIIYAGTGEGYFNVDALRGSGVLKSTDAGATWTLLTNFSSPNPSFGYYYINKLVIRSNDHNTLYAAMLGGVWKSTDAGASWAKLNTNTQVSVRCTDLVADPSNPDVMYATFGLFSTDGIYKTTNGGTTWSILNNGFPPVSEAFSRISLAISASNSQILYACLADSNYYTHSIQKSTNGGSSWFSVATPTDPLTGLSHLGGQGWYNDVIAVHPTNPNIVYTGGINMFKSTDGGTSWTMKTNWYTAGTYKDMHADQHAIAFDPSNASVMHFGNDGGMFKSTDGGENYSAINSHLVTAQLYSGAVHPSLENYLAGTQDNGTIRSLVPPAWSIVLGGDGGATAIDINTPTTMYSEYVYLCLQRSIASGSINTWSRTMNGIPTSGNGQQDGTSDRCLFIAPFVMDPSNPANLFAGTFRLWRSTNRGDLWVNISFSLPNNGDLTGDGDGTNQVGSQKSAISAIAIAKSSSATIYVGTNGSGTVTSRIQVTTNTGSTWTNVTKAPLPDRFVTAISIDPANPSRAFACFSGYDSGTPTAPGHVFLTTNRGTSWTNVSGNLPDIPINASVINPLNTNHFIIGTDLGIFESLDAGITWTQQNNGLANVAVFDLDVRGDYYVFAATHGRGMFKSTAPLQPARSPIVSIAIHQNPVLTRYVDLYVAAKESLNSAPTLQLTLNGGTPQSIVLTQQSPRVFKGSYEFGASGNVVLTSSALDSTGQTATTSRTFVEQLVKRGMAALVQSVDGNVRVAIGGDAVNEDMYFTIIPELEADHSPPLVSEIYNAGPSREFSTPLELSLSYSERMLGSLNDRTLAVYQLTNTGWQPLDSRVDPFRHVISARVNSLGRFAIGIREEGYSQIVPSEYTLFQNYPNPFNPSTVIRYHLPAGQAGLPVTGRVMLTVYDVLGQEVKTLVDEIQGAGEHSVSWEPGELPTGVYFYRLEYRQPGVRGMVFSESKKMLFVK